jgi:hypothetical protein
MKILNLVLCLILVSVQANAKPQQRGPDFDTIEKSLPVCVDKDRAQFRSNNEEVIRWKKQTQNQYKDRALVIGTLVGVLLDRSSHLHLQIDLDPAQNRGNDDQIEIVYNKSFGAVPAQRPGVVVAACGDYITARDRSGNFPPSPVGAVVHWVHASNNEGKHAHGFLSVNGVVYGNEGDAKKGRGNYFSFFPALLN